MKDLTENKKNYLTKKSMPMFCMNCGNEIAEENSDSNCEVCGKLPLSEKNYCYDCGTKTLEDAEICSNCQAPLVADYEFPEEVSFNPRFYRSCDEALIIGFCAGLARKWGFSIGFVRIVALFMPFSVFIYPIGFLLPAISTKRNPYMLRR